MAPERYQAIAKHLGLPASTPDEGVESYAKAVEALRDKVGIERSFADVGVDETDFMASLDKLAMNAYADQCAPANPRLPILEDMKIMMEAAYYGITWDEVKASRKTEAVVDTKKAPAKKAAAKKA